MKANIKKAIKIAGKVIAVYYLLEIIALAIWTVVNTTMCGFEATKKIYVSALGHVKDFYNNLFHFRWKKALGDYVDAELDGMDINVRAKFGDDVAITMMGPVYDELEKRHIPHSRVRYDDKKKAATGGGLDDIIKQMVHSGEYPEYNLDELERECSSSFETHPVEPDEVPEDIRRRAGE